jgi:hypothetical protein
MKFCPVVPEICRGQVHGPRKERKKERKKESSLKKLIYKICSCHDIVEILLNLIFAFIAVDRGFEPRSGHTKDYYIGICCFSAKHASLMRKSKDWLVWNQDNVFELCDYNLEFIHKIFLSNEGVVLFLQF